MLINPHILDSAVAEFIFTVDTTKAGSASDTFFLSLTSGTTNMTVYWGDGNSDVITAWNQSELTHVYSTSGSYQITLDGSFHGLDYFTGGDKLKLSSIDTWGTNQWGTMNSAFYGCTNLTANYSDQPDTSSVVSFRYAFWNCSSFNGVIDFDATSGTVAEYMFYKCTVLNSPITLSSSTVLTRTDHMFEQCVNLNSSVIIDTSAVSNMDYMFNSNPLFNQSLNGLDFSSVTTMSLFISNHPAPSGTYAFNNGGVAVNWNTTIITNFNNLFYQNYSLNVPVTLITNNVTNMGQMFMYCTIFDQDISGFNISSMTTASNMLFSSAFGTTNYDLLLVAWEGQTEKTGVAFHAGTAQYNTGSPATARGVLVGTSTWTITDGGAV